MDEFRPREPGSLSNEKGITPLAALIGMAIVMISLWGFLQANSSLKTQDVRSNRRVQGEQLLSGVALDMYKLGTSKLETLCTAWGALKNSGDPSIAASKCGDSGQAVRDNPKVYDSSLPVSDPNYPPMGIQVGYRIDSVKGNPLKGTTCVDIQRCEWRGNHHLLEVTLSGKFLVPPALSLSMKQLVFRKTP